MEVNKVVDVTKVVMDITREVLLIVGIIFMAAYSIHVSQKSVLAVQEMSNRIEMMFVKS